MRALLQVAAAILIGYLIGRRQAKNRQEEEADEAAKAADKAEARAQRAQDLVESVTLVK